MLSPFRIVLIFAVISIAGIIAARHLKINLLPQAESNTITIYFSLPNSSPDIVEQQVTSLIEGACSQLSMVRKINSVSNHNGGNLQIEYKSNTDMTYQEFELVSLMRRLYPQLPEGMSYPVISRGNGSSLKSSSPVLIYSLLAPLQSYQIREVAEQSVKTELSGIDGVKELRISGSDMMQVTIRFDITKCKSWNLEPSSVFASIRSYLSTTYPGQVINDNGEQLFLQVPSSVQSLTDIENLLISGPGELMISLKAIAKVSLEERQPQFYSRINGKNTITMSFFAREGENNIDLAQRIQQRMKIISERLPAGYEARLDFDNTSYLRKELHKNYKRIASSLGILLIFILLAYRKWKFLLNFFLGLAVSLSTTILLAWIFGINIHLYSIAGLAISFGILIDNSIVMLDHYHKNRNRSIFTAMLGATFTSIAALSLIFLLGDEERQSLADFAAVIILALISSLATAFAFTPAFHSIVTRKFLPKPIPAKKPNLFFNTYIKAIRKLSYARTFIIVLVIFTFGLPIFMLPSKLEGNQWYHRWYNASIGTETYQENIRPYMDRMTGGMLRLFVNNVFERNGYRDPEETRLYVSAEMDYGHTPQQMNEVIAQMEAYLQKVRGVEKYITNIRSGQSGNIEIQFDVNHQTDALPFQLKSRLVAKSLELGGVDWDIYGVGQGFSNANNDAIPTFRVSMKGYNYDELDLQARILSKKLSSNNRVRNVDINDQLDYDEKKGKEYVLSMDAFRMALYQSNQEAILTKINELSEARGQHDRVFMKGKYYPLNFEESNAGSFSRYRLFEHPIKLDSVKSAKLSDFSDLQLQTTANSIHKEDRQYLRMVSFEYSGAPEFGGQFLDEVIASMKREIPVGFSIEKKTWTWDWNKSNNRSGLILLLLSLIFLICGIMFESLRKPFFIITILPLSFIGLFMAFALGDFYFDQGGYAAFVLLGGIVANSAVFVINDVDRLREKYPLRNYNELLMEGVYNRMRTIILTTFSTCCGLVPFLLEGQDEPFWFSLAVGTLGGLICSLPVIAIILPLLMWRKKAKAAHQ